jgi:hypothetical protein
MRFVICELEYILLAHSNFDQNWKRVTDNLLEVLNTFLLAS